MEGVSRMAAIGLILLVVLVSELPDTPFRPIPYSYGADPPYSKLQNCSVPTSHKIAEVSIPLHKIVSVKTDMEIGCRGVMEDVWDYNLSVRYSR